MKRLVFLAALLAMTSCASTRYAPSIQGEKRDSVYISAGRLDSLINQRFKLDSIYVHDSIYVRERDDTVTKYVERIQYKYQQLHDTVVRYQQIRDTVFMERVDSVQVVQPVEVEKPIKWYNQAFIWLGRLCCIAAIIWALFLYLRRKRTII